MDFKTFKDAVSRKIKIKKRRFKGASMSYISLFIVLILVVVGTTAWFTTTEKINIFSDLFNFNSNTAIHDDQMQTLQTEIKLPIFKLEEASSVDGRNIYFPSSFFNNASDATSAVVATTKADKSSDTLVDWATTNNNMIAQTCNLRYREANAGDKNIHYAYGSADINSAGSETKVWLKGYKIVIGDSASNVNTETNCKIYHDQIDITYNGSTPIGQKFNNPYSCPVRIAIIDDSGHTPRIFDPSAKLGDYVDKTYAVYSIKNDGTPTSDEENHLKYTSNLESFASYYYGTDNPLFTIDPGHSINMTVVAWLEGTHPYASNFSGKYMSLSLEIETNVSEMEQIYLHDWTIGDTYESASGSSVTQSNYVDAADYVKYDGDKIICKGKWLSGDVNIAMSYFDQFADTYKTVVMTELNGSNTTSEERSAQGLNASGKDGQGRTVFRAAIPKYVNTKISFYRLSTYDDDVFPGTVFNAWHTYCEKDAFGNITHSVSDDLNSTASGWQVLGNLTGTRLVSGSTDSYVHYFAIRGNGNGDIRHDRDDRYEMWLQPGIGYWGNASGPVKVTS